MGEIERGNIRASDADRGRAADALEAHCAAGRITVDELDERVGKAMSARTLGELAELTDDLPQLSATAITTSTRSVEVTDSFGGGPGVRPFTFQLSARGSLANTRSEMFETLVPRLNQYGFALTYQSGRELQFERAGNKTLAIVLAVMFFPFGLLALRMVKDEFVAVSLELGESTGTSVVIHGSASRKVRQALSTVSL